MKLLLDSDIKPVKFGSAMSLNPSLLYCNFKENKMIDLLLRKAAEGM